MCGGTQVLEIVIFQPSFKQFWSTKMILSFKYYVLFKFDTQYILCVAASATELNYPFKDLKFRFGLHVYTVVY